MRLVCISQRVDINNNNDEVRDALDQRLNDLILRCGYLPVPVPNILGDSISDWLSIVKPSAIILSGGNDVGQCPQRDDIEHALLLFAKRNQLPLLGICRGMQMIANFHGVKLHNVIGHVRTRHNLTGEISDQVNSFHNYSISSCPKGFKVLAFSEDGEIEAIRHLSLNWEGWMWHPEREELSIKDVVRIKKLFDA